MQHQTEPSAWHRKSLEAFPLFCVMFLAVYVLPVDRFPFLGGAGPEPTAEKFPGALASHLQGGPRTGPRSLRGLKGSLEQDRGRTQPRHGVRPSGPAEESVPPIPRPLRSELVASKGGLGGINATFTAFEGWGDCSSIIEFLREDLRRDGWHRNLRVETLAQGDLPGILLSYSRGHEHLLLTVERVRETGTVETLALYVEKDWLPPDIGF